MKAEESSVCFYESLGYIIVSMPNAEQLFPEHYFLGLAARPPPESFVFLKERLSSLRKRYRDKKREAHVKRILSINLILLTWKI